MFLFKNWATIILSLLCLHVSMFCVFCTVVCMFTCVCVFVQSCCSEAEAQQAGRMQTTSQPIQCELPTIPVQIGSHFLKGVSFNESAAENLKLKTVGSLARLAIFILLILVTHLVLPKRYSSPKCQPRFYFHNSVVRLCQSHQLFLAQWLKINLTMFWAITSAEDSKSKRLVKTWVAF